MLPGEAHQGRIEIKLRLTSAVMCWCSSGTLTDMDGKMFQLVLTLIRNLLAVDDPSSPLVRASAANTQAAYFKDALMERLFNENVMDLLLALTQHVGGEHPFLRQDNLLILEILHYLLSGQMPDAIASSREKVEKVLDFIPLSLYKIAFCL
jgi:timeless